MQNLLKKESGFTLIETLVAIAVITILSVALISYSVTSMKLERSVKEVVGTMDYITCAAMNFYLESQLFLGSQKWPNSISEMKDYGYLPPNWSDTNPWGNSYSISYTDHLFTLSTTVPQEIGNAIARRLKLSNVVVSGSNATVSTTVVKPWAENL